MINKTKIAFVKFAGIASGGTEKFLQTIAANLSKESFEVDYFYTNAAPYVNSDYKHAPNDEVNGEYLKKHNVNLIPVHVDFKDITKPDHPWLGTDFFDLFDETKYDVVVTGRAGHPEFPYNKIKNTPIVEIITLPGMADRQSNIVKSVHISNFQANTWVRAGGDPTKVSVIPLIADEIVKSGQSMHDELGIPKSSNAIVFGFHQREDDGICSTVSLDAYKKVMNDNTYFVILGGSKLYQKYADANKLKNFIQLPFSPDNSVKDKFLETLDVYTHARKDGETFGLAIAEAMSYGLPILSHVAPAMGHVETIGNAGSVCSSIDEYAKRMSELMDDDNGLWNQLSENAKTRYQNEYSVDQMIIKFSKIFEEIGAEKAKDKMSDEDFWGSI